MPCIVASSSPIRRKRSTHWSTVIVLVAVIQGITEFLPISSSGHLILVPYLMHWPDQGQFVDVMVHVGTLFAILIYFWRDVWRITVGGLELFKGKVTQITDLDSLVKLKC